MPDAVPVEDVREIVRLLARVAILEGDLPAKRRFLMEGLAKLVQADYWFWLQFKDDVETSTPVAFAFVDGGHITDAQRLRITEGSINPGAAFLNSRLRVGSDRHITRRRVDVVDDGLWFASEYHQLYYGPAGLGDFLSSVYPLGGHFYSSIMFLRQQDKPPFSPREICIVHLLTEEIDWLHRQGTDLPAGERVNDLSPRQRQVLFRVMSGDSVKQIAKLLSLSPHTVNDHLKLIYKRFDVNSRSQLLAQFFGGGVSKNAG